MTAIAQLDQLITALQGLKANLAQSSAAQASRPAATALPGSGQSFADVLSSISALSEEVAPPPATTEVATAASSPASPAPSTLAMLSQTALACTAIADEDFLTTDLGHARAHRPSVKEFMNATGLGFNDAASLVSIGTSGYADHRNWEKIMASADPAQAASIANGQQFGSGVEWAPYRDDSSMLQPERVIAQSGNYALYRMPARSESDEGYVTLQMVDAAGRRLTQAGVTAEQISRNAWLYGFDKSAVAELASVADQHNPSLAAAMRSVA